MLDNNVYNIPACNNINPLRTINACVCLEKTSDRTKRRKYTKQVIEPKTHIYDGQMIVGYEEA